MTDLLYSLNTVLPVFLMVLIGYFLVQMKIMTEDLAEKLSVLCFDVLIPVSIFREVYKTNIMAGMNIGFITYAMISVFGLMLVAMMISPLFFKENRARSGAVAQAIFRCNYVIVGIPLVQNMFSSEEAASALAVIPFSIAALNIGAVTIMTIFSGGGEKKKINILKIIFNVIKSPITIALLLGIAASAFRISFPTPVIKTIDSIGATGTPMALIAMGGQFNLKRAMKNIRISAMVTFVRLIVVPAVMLSLAVLFGWRGGYLGTMLSLFGTPTATSTYPLAKKMNSDAELLSEIILLTSLCCTASMFFFIYVMRIMKLI